MTVSVGFTDVLEVGINTVTLLAKQYYSRNVESKLGYNEVDGEVLVLNSQNENTLYTDNISWCNIELNMCTTINPPNQMVDWEYCCKKDEPVLIGTHNPLELSKPNQPVLVLIWRIYDSSHPSSPTEKLVQLEFGIDTYVQCIPYTPRMHNDIRRMFSTNMRRSIQGCNDIQTVDSGKFKVVFLPELTFKLTKKTAFLDVTELNRVFVDENSPLDFFLFKCTNHKTFTNLLRESKPTFAAYPLLPKMHTQSTLIFSWY